MIVLSQNGIYCPEGDFFIDPTRKVEKGIITHGHADHLKSGLQQYWMSKESEPLARVRISKKAKIESKAYEEPFYMQDIKVTLYPAGHILGSSMVLMENHHEKWLVSGDYKTDFDPTCTSIKIPECDVFITEATFAKPYYKWKPTPIVIDQIKNWWQLNQKIDYTSIIAAYSLGKAQRLIAELSPFGTVYCSPTIETMNEAYRSVGIPIPKVEVYSIKNIPKPGALVISESNSNHTRILRKIKKYSLAQASGWAMLEKGKKSSTFDVSFVLSDHADWNGIISTIKTTKAKRVYITHGEEAILIQYLQEQGIDAAPLTDLADVKMQDV